MSQKLTIAIAEGVANAEDVNMTELDVILSNHIDCDGLERIARHESSTWTVSFELPDHNVTVTSEGLVLVDEQKEATWKSPASRNAVKASRDSD